MYLSEIYINKPPIRQSHLNTLFCMIIRHHTSPEMSLTTYDALYNCTLYYLLQFFFLILILLLGNLCDDN